MISRLYRWKHEKEDELMDNGDCSPKTLVKAFCIGAVDGLIDVVCVIGFLWYVGGLISRITKKSSFMNSKF